jgi:hypothetical protein
MRNKITQWFRRRFRELDLLEEYFSLLFTRWQAVIWGGSVLAVAFGWRFITSDWPHFIKLSACVVALFFAGYYVWRTDHVRLIPKLELVSLHMIYTPTNVPNLQRRFVQVLVRCATESPLDNCRGQLLRILKWSQGDWQPTLVDESLDLLWSNADIASVTLEPGNDKRLNVFFVDSATRNILPFAERMSMRLLLVCPASAGNGESVRPLR